MNKRLSQVRSAPSLLSQRKGTHVGVIISFAIFITFLVFLFLILEPSINVNGEKEAVLDDIELSLLDYLTSEITTISIRVNDQIIFTGENCLKFNQVNPLNETGLGGEHMFVKNLTGSNLQFNWFSAQRHLETENNGINRFFKIYASNGIESSETDFPIVCQNIQPGRYTVGVVKTEEHILEKNILDVIELYRTNYTLLKQNIGLMTVEFGFDFIYNNGTILSTEESSQRVSIYTKEVSFDYLDKNLNDNVGSMVIKTW